MLTAFFDFELLSMLLARLQASLLIYVMALSNKPIKIIFTRRWEVSTLITRNVWVVSNFWQLWALRIKRGSTNAKCNSAARRTRKISHCATCLQQSVKYSWQPDGQICRWLNYLWFFSVVIVYNKAKVLSQTMINRTIIKYFTQNLFVRFGSSFWIFPEIKYLPVNYRNYH